MNAYFTVLHNKEFFETVLADFELLHDQQSCMLPLKTKATSQSTLTDWSVLKEKVARLENVEGDSVDDDKRTGIYDSEIMRHAKLLSATINSEDLD